MAGKRTRPAKRWFGASSKTQEGELSTEDLIILERYGEAEERLKRRLKSNPQALHAHLKLAEVYAASRKLDKAVEEYLHVARAYAQDGFYDKGIALLAKAARLRPLDDTLPVHIQSLERAKGLERSRQMAIEGLRANPGNRTAVVELQRLWHNLTSSSLVDRLAPEEIKRLFTVLELVRMEEGQVLVEEGSRTPALMLVAEGVIEVVSTLPGKDPAVVRTFTHGDLIGEGALLEHRPWPATYRAAEPTVLFRLERSGLEQALLGNPDPRRFLDVLREQRNDRSVAETLQRLG